MAKFANSIILATLIFSLCIPAKAQVPVPKPSPFKNQNQPQENSVQSPNKTEQAPTNTPKETTQFHPKSHEEAIARIDKKLNTSKTMSANFMQIAPDGKKSIGKLYILRPGRFLFKYDSPSQLELVADGSNLSIRDRKLGTQDIYPLSQTPLRFLSRDKIRLEKDTKVLSSSIENDMLLIKLLEESTLGGKSKITLYFDLKNDDLLQWTVIDPQGFETNVVLSDLDYKTNPNPNMFYIDTGNKTQTN